MRAGIGLAVALALLANLAGCASAPARETAPDRDRTDDPEFVAAREAARPEFETQADALAAGVYEPFVHPDSVTGAVVPPAGAARPSPSGDPTTQELLGTLERPPTYNPVPTQAPWTLQMGAFDTEAGALVRIRQLEREFPDLPLWTAAGDAPAGGAGERLHRVFMGRFGDRGAAESARSAVADRHPDAWVTRAP